MDVETAATSARGSLCSSPACPLLPLLHSAAMVSRAHPHLSFCAFCFAQRPSIASLQRESHRLVQSLGYTKPLALLRFGCDHFFNKVLLCRYDRRRRIWHHWQERACIGGPHPDGSSRSARRAAPDLFIRERKSGWKLCGGHCSTSVRLFVARKAASFCA